MVMLESLKESNHGKLCVMSSKLTKEPKPFWGAYSISKAALEQMIYSWHLENKKSNIKVYIIHPKPINTKLRKTAMPGEDEKKNQTPTNAAVKLFTILSQKNDQNESQSPQNAAHNANSSTHLNKVHQSRQ